MSHTVADQLVAFLAEAGVRRIYGIVGDSLNAFSDAVRRSGRLEWVHVHNEEAAAFAASAEAQVTGRLAVCAGSCGPGNTHLIQGVLDAHRSGAPVLALASHIASRQIGSGFFQETKPEALFAPASHYCETVAHPEQMARLSRLAVQNAVGKSGASVLVLPGDVLAADAVEHDRPERLVTSAPRTAPDPEEIRELADRIAAADKVAIFAGIGCTDARAEVLELAGRLQAPIGHTLRGKDVFGWDNPFDVGMTGLLGYGACYEALHEADLVLLLGTDFPYDDFLPGARTVQVDRDPARLGRRTPLVQGVAADVGLTLRALLPLLEQRTGRKFLDTMLRHTEHTLRTAVEAYTGEHHQRIPIHPEYLARVVDRAAAPDAVFTVDTGMCCTWAARYLTPTGQRRILGSFVHGSMANALPMAIGAQFAAPGRQVVSFSGDGGLAMLLGELLTVRRHRLPVKTVVFNNSSLGMVRLEMMVAGDPPFETDHEPVDFAAIAAAAGLYAERVTDPANLTGAVEKWLAHDGPALLDVVTTPDALEVPSHVTIAETRGFALSLGKTVLGGGVGEAIELARQNLRNIPH
ncbi:thiamine pyrophosphate-dependent enzyme [Cryptosporangium phraense]|uniref:Ubiquinone-dependent pyruvate dehydrogenase n=1 Tax=Cryptosporangium phraense TaxID=2593070 RepID=A0A545AQ61_9ACTN|nr:thiamine pyrophosphate-dependent enzyme [Cryptosporangium phraense]TQS43462.1 ubiquinone-dependent pyruvate dehydrogenase [Cryptosporangium phraense]